ncbi:hypothetical protein DY000_02018093 [Brassica cretica]|uniref:Uncharacterized protein n=1 Tax=Brassica cretica TaxID=69181 RepID=A0ABQ7CKJ9_BRACR|nr:hypothetical protein DY000_02018093 [Brassica cretica]
MVPSTPFAWGPCRGRLGRGQCIPGPFSTPVLGGLVLPPLLLEPRFLFCGFLDQFMDITVVPHVAAVPQEKLSTLGQGRLIATTILRAAKDLFADMNGNYL